MNSLSFLRFITPLPRSFFARSPRRVAREILGKILIRNDAPQLLAARIIEVEAYLGKKDPAAHAYAGETLRTSVLFGPPGHAYVYFIYGNHYCLNVSCEPEGKAGSILFRALEPLQGLEQMAHARNITLKAPRDLLNLTTGPGRLAQAYGITRARDYGRDLTLPESGLWLAEDGFRSKNIQTAPRVGITKALDHPLRFFFAGNPFVSRPRSVAPRKVHSATLTTKAQERL